MGYNIGAADSSVAEIPRCARDRPRHLPNFVREEMIAVLTPAR
jgi:hypothetical protein